MPSENDDSSIRGILEAICAGGRLEMDFKEVAKNFGISRSDNAGTKFQGQLKRWGYKYDRTSGTLSKIDGADGAPVPITPKKKPATPKKTPATNGEKASGEDKPSNKKRKLDKGDVATGDDIQVVKEESEDHNV